MSEMEELLERVKAATEPSREIDTAIELVVGAAPRKLGAGPAMRPACPPYSYSIDAALALVERMLPGWGIEIGIPANRGGVGNARLYPGDDRNAEMTFFGSAQTPTLAILEALLTALISQEQK